MRPVHWIETELSQHFKNLDLTRGADLNRNGKIEGSERTDLNSDGNVDSAEWQKFTGNNKAALETLGGHFKQYYSAGCAFKPDNPIHDLLSIESELFTPDEVNKAYEKVEEILRIVRERLAGAELIPEDKLRIVYDAMKEVGIKFEQQNDIAFVGTINMRVLDCDTSSFVVLAVAHELNWPVHLVRAPGHIFIRWDDHARTRFNMDFGYTHADDFYLKQYNISQDAIDQGIYMRNMEYDDILSLFYSNRGDAKSELGRFDEAIDDYDKAIELDPNDAAVLNNRGVAKRRLGRYEEAIRDYDKALALDPNLASVYYNRDSAKRRLGRYEEAYDRAIERDPNDATAYYGRGNAELGLKRYEEAIRDYDKAIELDPNDAAAYYNRGNAKFNLGRFDEAIRDYDKAIELDPNHAEAYDNRNIAKEELKRSVEAIREPEKVLEINPPPSCLCNTVGQAGNSSPSDPSLLSLLLTLVFD